MTRAFAIALIVLTPPAVSAADEPMPLGLKQRWVSSAGHRGEEWLHSFSRDGKLAFFEQRAGGLIARDTTTWKKTGQLLVNADQLQTRRGVVVANSPDDRLWASSVESAGKRGWYDLSLGHTGDNEALATAKAAHRQQPLLLFSHDGKMLISASLDALILWDVPGLKAPRKLGPVNADPRGKVSRLVLSPDGQTLGVTCNYFRCEDQVWDLKAGRMRVALGGHTAQVWSVAFSPDGKTIASRGNDPQIKIWDAATGLNTLSIPLESGHALRPVAFRPDGKEVATADGRLVRLFDARTGKATRTLKGHTSNVNALAFSPNGKQLVSGSGRRPRPEIDREREPGEVIVWDLATEKARHVLKAHPLGASAVAWSPDGALVATAGYGHPRRVRAGKKGEGEDHVFLWDATTAKRVRSMPAKTKWGVSVLAFSPDGKWIVHDTERDGTSATRVVEIRTGKEISSWHGAGSAMAFSPDGSMLASVGSNWIGLFDPRTGDALASHTIPDGDANTVAWGPDGKSLATGGSDRTVRLWDLIARRKE